MFYRPNQRLHFLASPKKKNQLQAEDRSKSKSCKALPAFLPRVAAKVIKKQVQNPQEQPRVQQTKAIKKQSFVNSSTIKQFKSYFRSPQNIAQKLGSPQPMSHNLSSNNLRNIQKNGSFIANKTAQTFQNDKDLSKNKTSKLISHNNLNLNRSIKLKSRSNQKINKDPPSFLRNKHTSTSNMADIQIIKQLGGQSGYLVRNKKLSALFQMQIFSKEKLANSNLYLEFRQQVQNSNLSNKLIAKFIGYLSDQSNIYIFQEYLHGDDLKAFIKSREYQFNQSQLGAKIYDILIVLSYLKQIGHPHGPITTDHIVYTMNTCKFKRTILKSPISTACDQFYDIWCLGNIIFQVITGQELIPANLFKEPKSLAEIFNSTLIAKCIQKGLKKLQQRHLSRELIEFLIASIWTVQHRQITFEKLFNFQFIKMFRDDDIWLANNKSQ